MADDQRENKNKKIKRKEEGKVLKGEEDDECSTNDSQIPGKTVSNKVYQTVQINEATKVLLLRSRHRTRHRLSTEI